MAKPKWFLQGIAIMSVFLYSVDVGSDFWVGIDLYLRCHYHYAATVFTWILVPGFIYGWVIFFQGGVECYWKAVLKAQIREQMSGPDLHVFTLKFLALKNLVFSLSWGQKFFFLNFVKKILCNFSVRTL